MHRGSWSWTTRRSSWRTASLPNILDYLRPGDLLVGNNSRVIPARLHGVKETGGAVEIFLLRSAQVEAAREGDLRSSARPRSDMAGGAKSAAWECLVGGKGLRPGVRVYLQHPSTPPGQPQPGSAQDAPPSNSAQQHPERRDARIARPEGAKSKERRAAARSRRSGHHCDRPRGNRYRRPDHGVRSSGR